MASNVCRTKDMKNKLDLLAIKIMEYYVGDAKRIKRS